jgi:integration host factor subunit alpha
MAVAFKDTKISYQTVCNNKFYSADRSNLTMTLTKVQLVDSIHKETNLSRKKSLVLVESLLEIIKQTLENGEDVLISGFGKFCIKEKQERKGRNPATGDDMMLAPRMVVTFRCSPMLRKIINT